MKSRLTRRQSYRKRDRDMFNRFWKKELVIEYAIQKQQSICPHANDFWNFLTFWKWSVSGIKTNVIKCYPLCWTFWNWNPLTWKKGLSHRSRWLSFRGISWREGAKHSEKEERLALHAFLQNQTNIMLRRLQVSKVHKALRSQKPIARLKEQGLNING